MLKLTKNGQSSQGFVSRHLKSNPRRYRRVIYESNPQRRVGSWGRKPNGNTSEPSTSVIAKQVFGRNEKTVWLKPRLVAQIEFTEWTPDNHLRHSKFVGLRDDKDAREVVQESEGKR